MFAYLLQVTLCLAVFYGPYAAFLRKETFFAINRWYLLGTLGLSVCAPLLLLLPEDFFFTKHNSTLMYTLEPITVGIQEVRNSLTPSASDSIWMIIALSVYWIGVILLVFRFAMNLRSILKLYQHGEHVKGRHRIIYSSHPHQPFSFFHWIFLSKDHGLNPEELEEVLTHESVHAAAWHSLDVLFTELARTILWPSPLIYLYHKSLRRVHEYLADAEVLRHSTLKNYGQLLFSQATSGIQFALVHHFFQSHLKNRIFMMTKHKSNRIALVKYVSLLPIAILIMAIFAFRDSADRASQYDISGWFVHDSIPSQVYKVVDEMPRFPGCEDSGLISEELNQCALQKMLEHVYAQIKYPKEARDLGVSGRVIVQFVVRKDGSVSDVQVIKSIGHGTDEVVLEVVKSMPRWRPGINEGKVVDVEFTLPIAFKLDGQANQEMSITDKVVVTAIGPSASDAEIFKIVDVMPRFPGCEDSGLTGDAIFNCAQKDMLEFIYANLNYPEEAKQKQIQGRSVAQFVIRRDGQISDATIVRSIGYGTDAEVLRVVKAMPAWRPGYHEGKAVDVQFTIPFSFKLTAETTSPVPDVHSNPYMVVEEMPRFPGCENSGLDGEALKRCVFEKLTQFVQDHMKYPEAAKKAGIEGRGVVQFVVRADGQLTDAKVVRSIGFGTDQVLIDIFKAMQEMPERWRPGFQGGKAVDVTFTLPVTFKLPGE